jgi:cell wall-associated NlpC family hydrolase
MNKKFAAIIVFGLTMTTCASPAIGEVRTNKTVTYDSQINTSGMIPMLKEQKAKQTKLEKDAKIAKDLQSNTLLMKQALKNLNKHVQKTWYVFSGSTPSGWDCSGMTMWFYEQLGINLVHRASVQDQSGVETNTPKPGDLVIFKYTNSNQAYHVGIYIGNGEMIHAPRNGEVTRVENVETFGGNYSKISYRRIVNTN